MNKIKRTLIDWKLRLNKAQIGHYMSSEKYSNNHKLIGILSLILSAILIGVLFVDHQQLENAYFRWLLKFTSITIAILNGIQAFLRPGEKAELHRSKATQYGVLKRRIELYVLLDKYNDAESFLPDVQREWTYITEDAPVTPKSIRIKIKDILSKEMRENKEMND